MGCCMSTNEIYKALYSYDGQDEGDLAFLKGDMCTIINKNSSEWWTAQNLRTKKIGLVPSNYIALYDPSINIENEEWWFKCNRREANTQLKLPGLKRGTFLIRKSQTEDRYAMSVRDFEDISDDSDVKHYHILISNNKFYIKPSVTFKSLSMLVEHHKKHQDGLCCQLTNPCPKAIETIPFKNMELDRNCIELLERLGTGNFGEVWKAKYKKRQTVAIKKLKIDDESNSESFINEAKFLHSVRHKYLVQLVGVCTVGRPLYIVMEFMKNGALNTYLQNDLGRTVKFLHLLDIATQIASGMAFIESKEFLHRDLRGANVLLDEVNHVKIADFGLAKIESEYVAKPTSLFPIKWAAPEVIEYSLFTIKSDVWSYGVLLYEIISYGKTPYEDLAPKDILPFLKRKNVPANPVSLNKPYIRCPNKFYQKMTDCWIFDKKDRPSFEQLLSFFEAYYSAEEDAYQKRISSS